MDLNLPLARTFGRASKPVGGTVVRRLGPSDLEGLNAERGTEPIAIKRIGQRHHALAKLLASGTKEWEAAAIVGYTLSRVSVLKGDPTFKELVAFYKGNVDAEYLQLHEALAGLSLDAANELRLRLEEDPESIPLLQLAELVKMGADRTGHGPSSSQNVNVNLNIGSRLEEARKRIEARKREVIEGSFVEVEATAVRATAVPSREAAE